MIGQKIKNEVLAWGSLGVVIVIISVILLKFLVANPGDIACTAPFTYTPNVGACCNSTVSCAGVNQTTVNGVGQTVNTFVSALSEPKNWVAIVIIAMIGFAVLYLFTKKRNR